MLVQMGESECANGSNEMNVQMVVAVVHMGDGESECADGGGSGVDG